MRVLVTGATGFVGRALLSALSADPTCEVRGAVRRSLPEPSAHSSLVRVGELSVNTDWRAALVGVHAVVHTAARSHVMNDRVTDPLAEFRRINVDATLSLARQAVTTGVRRLLFLSSIKVNGESTPEGRPFIADDPPNPTDAYALSKHEAEQGLRQIGKDTGLEIVIIRPVLVYGPGVAANFLSMMRWLDKGLPLPLGAIHNKRSLVALDNLIDMIKASLQHPAAANQTFLVSDGEDFSTPELLRLIGAAMGQPARLIPVPEFVLRWAATMAGKGDIAKRLCGSLQVDIGKTRKLLEWDPPLGAEKALSQTARYFLDTEFQR